MEAVRLLDELLLQLVVSYTFGHIVISNRSEQIIFYVSRCIQECSRALNA